MNTIVIAEDHPLFRKALRDLMSTHRDLSVAGEAGNGPDALELVRTLRPDLLLLDLNLPGCSGLEVIQRMRDLELETRVIVLTMSSQEEVFNKVMDAGVDGYVLKESAVEVIADSIRAVLRGETYITPTLSHFLVSRRTKARDFETVTPGLADLTATERKILKLIADNKTSREIATLLFVSEKTVENHRLNISAKLKLRGSNSLLKFAIENRSAIALL